jgi:hypothetical protein
LGLGYAPQPISAYCSACAYFDSALERLVLYGLAIRQLNRGLMGREAPMQPASISSASTVSTDRAIELLQPFSIQQRTPYSCRLDTRRAVRLLQVQVRDFLSHSCEIVQTISGCVLPRFRILSHASSHTPWLCLVPNLETVGVGVTPVHATWSLLEGME